MEQTRIMSLIEAITNVVVGYGIAVATQLIVFPWFGLLAHLDNALEIGGIFTVVSIVRSFVLRRIFEALRARDDMERERRSGVGRTTAGAGALALAPTEQ